MNLTRKKIAIILVIGFGIFGFTQYAFATQIGVIVKESQLLEKTSDGSIYNVQLEFNNPSLLILQAGETDFVISADEKHLADGELSPFVLPALSKVIVDGKYQTKNSDKLDDSQASSVMIKGITKYDLLFTQIDVPFIYFPTDDQAREFIHQN